MDAPCKIQGSIHVFRLVNNMCPGKWVHITLIDGAFYHMINILSIESILAFTNSRRVIKYRLYIHF